jgi:hypothetical protein
MLPYPISSNQTDANSPVDDNLMDSIRQDLDYLDATIAAGGVPTYVWNLTGRLNTLPGRIAKRIDMQFLHSSQTFNRVRLAQEIGGDSGVTEIDIRYHSKPKTPITAIAPQFTGATQSIAQIGSSLATQSIALATAAISTQSIARAKSALNVQSIINVLGTNQWRYNLDSAPDSDWQVGDSVTFASCSSANNNGTFTIVEVNQSGHPSIVVTNASGVAQTGVAGNVNLNCWSYNQTNPVNSHYTAGESVIMASHTTGANNGTFTIYAINNGGNNIWIKNASGVAQAGVAGTATCTRWTYTYSSSVNTSHYVAGEKCRMASHTTGANNGDFFIRAVNSGGNNIVITNASGVAQGGVAGNATSLRWKYSFSSDPSSNVSVGHNIVMSSHSNANNDGTFEVVGVNDTTSNNFYVYNASGVAQAGVAGTCTHTYKVISFGSDQSLLYSTDSYIEMEDTTDEEYNANNYTLPFKVLEVNRGGGSNYNVVIDNEAGGSQSSPAGYVAIEARSIFTADDGDKPQLSTDLTALSPNGLLMATFTGADISASAIPAQTYMGLYILQIQEGTPQNLSVMLT